MSAPADHRAHSDAHREAGGATRLDAIVGALERRCGGDAQARERTRVVEIGCGTGNVAVPVASLGYRVTGIDVDGASIVRARERCPFEWARFDVLDPGQLEPGGFEAAICAEVLEHLEDPADCLRKVHRLLVPGGSLIVTVPNGYGPWETMNRAKRLVGRAGLGGLLRSVQRVFGYEGRSLQSLNPHLEHVQFFTRVGFLELARRSGFRLVADRNLTCVVTVFPVSWIFRRLPAVERFDARLARALPAILASGWLFELIREGA